MQSAVVSLPLVVVVGAAVIYSRAGTFFVGMEAAVLVFRLSAFEEVRRCIAVKPSQAPLCLCHQCDGICADSSADKSAG